MRQGVQDAAKDSSVQVQLIETNAQGDISKESTFVDTLVARNVDAIILSAVSENGSSRTVRRASEAGIPVICYNTCINQKGVDKYVSAGNDSNLLIVFYVQIMPDDFVMQLHRF